MNTIDARFNLTRPGHNPFQLDVNLQLPATGVTALFGHSGSGKTTLLRCIAGLQHTDNGYFSLAGEQWQQGQSARPTHQRPLGYVFQEASLFSHLNAEQNLQYALKRANPGSPLLTLQEAVELLGIGHLMQQPTSLLSGGERQRLAIARALLINPKLLLMDEPLAALDAERKQDILPYLERLKNEVKIPIIYVSHAVDEVARLADYLVVLEGGKVKQQGPLQECLASVSSPITLGEDTGVIIEGEVAELDQQYQRVGVRCSAGLLWIQAKNIRMGDRLRIRILARDISLALAAHEDTSINNILPAEVLNYRVIKEDAYALVRLTVGEDVIISKITQRSLDHLAIRPGQRLWAQIKAVALVQ